MAEAIQFHCPACGITLRVPVAASGTQGPCPRCQQEIVCPDLNTGTGARRVAAGMALAAVSCAPRNPREDDPFNPFANRPPAATTNSEAPAPEPQAPAPEAPEPLPDMQEPLPDMQEPLPDTQEPLPDTQEPLPDTQEPLPDTQEPLPDTLEPLPDAPEPLPSGKEAHPPASETIDPELEATEDEPPLPHRSGQPFAATAAEGPLGDRIPVNGEESPGSPPPAPAAAAPALSPMGIMVLLLFVSVLAAFAGFVAGYAWGSRNAPLPAAPVSPPAISPPAQAPPAPPRPKDEPPVPPVEPPPPPEESPAEPPPIRIITAPEAALKAFLSAPDWRSRAKHVLHPDRVAMKMEAYHVETPDGPTAPLSLKVDASHDDPEKGSKLFTYRVATEAAPDGFPVAVVETPEGWKVDWESFVEFRDDHFRRFAAGEGSDVGTFHLLVRNSHYFGEPFPGSDQLTAFRVDPPLPEREQYAFVPTGSDLHKALAAATEWGRPCAPVLQLGRKTHADGKTHLEITAILAPNWRPEE